MTGLFGPLPEAQGSPGGARLALRRQNGLDMPKMEHWACAFTVFVSMVMKSQPAS